MKPLTNIFAALRGFFKFGHKIAENKGAKIPMKIEEHKEQKDIRIIQAEQKEIAEKKELIKDYIDFVKMQHKEGVSITINDSGKVEMEITDLEKVIRVKDKQRIRKVRKRIKQKNDEAKEQH